MNYLKPILFLTLLVAGSILISNHNGSLKTIGIAFLAITILNYTSVKGCSNDKIEV